MEQGVIFTKDKKDIEVFFLKPQGSFSPHPSEPNTWVVNDPETAKALLEDNMDCCDETETALTETYEGTVGHVGKTGWKGYDSAYDAILDTIKRFEDTQLNISSETAQEVLAMSIEVKLKHFYDEK